MRRYILFITLVIIAGCKKEDRSGLTLDKIKNVVGEVYPNNELDDLDFKICNEQDQIVQYYAFNDKTYEGEKIAITEHFRKKYSAPKNNSESGYIRVRFIVNCEGKSGRFRLLESNLDYEPITFSKNIKQQLLNITKSLKDWKPMVGNNRNRDYYQYLIFKIENGQLIDILP